MVGIIDYGVGNLFSLKSSFAAIGEACVVSGDPEVIRRADRLVLPGVGAFADAMDYMDGSGQSDAFGDAAQKLRDSGLFDLVRDEAKAGKPLLGICLGMQLLFKKSFEYGVHEGLGLIPGEVVPIAGCIPAGLKIPHIGWNALLMRVPSPLYEGVPDGSHVYFVHSYHAGGCREYATAVTEYGGLLTASVQRENVAGCQFHPEKSGQVGLRILKNFAKM